MINIYTDGSSRGNPGRAGSAAIMIYGDNRKELSKGFRLSTNNRMELYSVILALSELKRFDVPITIYSDSRYVTDPFNKKWISGWIKRDFNNLKNVDLWRTLLAILDNVKTYEFVWVKGHASNIENNNCDILAVKAALSDNLEIDVEYEKLKK